MNPIVKEEEVKVDEEPIVAPGNILNVEGDEIPFLGSDIDEPGLSIDSNVTAGLSLAATGIIAAALFYITKKRCFNKTDEDFERV